MGNLSLSLVYGLLKSLVLWEFFHYDLALKLSIILQNATNESPIIGRDYYH